MATPIGINTNFAQNSSIIAQYAGLPQSKRPTNQPPADGIHVEDTYEPSDDEEGPGGTTGNQGPAHSERASLTPLLLQLADVKIPQNNDTRDETKAEEDDVAPKKRDTGTAASTQPTASKEQTIEGAKREFKGAFEDLTDDQKTLLQKCKDEQDKMKQQILGDGFKPSSTLAEWATDDWGTVAGWAGQGVGDPLNHFAAPDEKLYDGPVDPEKPDPKLDRLYHAGLELHKAMWGDFR